MNLNYFFDKIKLNINFKIISGEKMSHYDTLGIKKDASNQEIKDAYKKLVKKYHPDVYPGDKSFAEKKTQEINYAYDILSNEESKKAYDEKISPSYDHTPPKYNNPENYSYQNYYAQNNSSDFESYKRYTDYHRSKTPNSNYTVHDEFSDNIVNSVNKLSSKKKSILILSILFIYVLFLIVTFFQIHSILDGKSSGTLLNTQVNFPEINTNPANSYDNEDSTNDKYYDENYENFNINDYVSDDKLKQMYEEYYYMFFDSYDEFKDTLSDYLYFNYDF